MKKILTALLCSALILGLSGCVSVKDLFGGRSRHGEDVPPAYNEILDTYKELLLCKKKGSELSKPNKKGEILDVVYKTVEACEDPALMGYSTKDLNGDGIQELILLQKDCRLYALFTLVETRPVLLIDLESRGVIDENGTIYYTSQKGDEGKRLAKKIVEGRLEGIEYGWVRDATVEAGGIFYKIVQGERVEITGGEKSKLDQKFEYIFFNSTQHTKRADLRFLPAIEDGSATEKSIPMADCSSYESILEMYKRIVGTYRSFDRAKWADGEYDDLFRFEDNESYEVFNSILYSGYVLRPKQSIWKGTYAEKGDNAYGYAKKDLNGDGAEELLLMTDSFDILAIFTMRNGRAVMLDHYTGGKQCWFGNDGYLRVEWNNDAMTEIGFMMYSITEQANLKTETHIVYAAREDEPNSYAYYSVDNGNRNQITNEEGQAKYDLYYVCKGLCQPSEYTKTYAGLQFVPLFDRVPPTALLLNKKYTHYGFIGDLGVTLLSVENNEVAFSIDYLKGGENQETPYETVITATATLGEDGYSFDSGTVRGRLEFGVNGIWVILLESTEEQIDCHAYYYHSYPGED